MTEITTATSATNSIEVLLARVESATGPNVRLDAMIHAMVAPGDFLDEDADHYATYPDVNRADMRYLRDMMVPAYTGSVDASMRLVERLLPGWFLILNTNAAASSASARLMEPLPGARYSTTGKMTTAPLAILSSLLKALLAKSPVKP